MSSRTGALVVVYADQLSPPPDGAVSLAFDVHTLGEARRMAATEARMAGFGRARVEDVRLAVNELASNSIEHGAGRGMLRIWHRDHQLVCDVFDGGRLTTPVVDSPPTAPDSSRGRGLPLVSKVADEVFVRITPDGTVFRAHFSLPPG